jgi:MFS family permease
MPEHTSIEDERELAASSLIDDEEEMDHGGDVHKRLLSPATPTSDTALEAKSGGPSWRVYALASATFYLAAVDLLSYTIIQPFLPQYLREKFPHLPKENIGSITGWVLGSFFIARFFSNTVIGHISDLYGRKWPMIVSLLVSTIATGVFTFLNSIWLLVLVRLVHGFFSATSALAKAQLVDVSTGNNIPTATRSLLFAYLGSTFAMSRAASSAMGGIIVGIGIAVKSDNPYVFSLRNSYRLKISNSMYDSYSYHSNWLGSIDRYA